MEKTTIQVDKEIRLALKKIALELGDITMNDAIKELINEHNYRKSIDRI